MNDVLARHAGVAAALLCLALPAAVAAQAGPPTSPHCLPLAPGSTGMPLVGQAIPSRTPPTARGPGGFGAPATIALPDDVALKSPTQSFSAEYAFVVRDGHVYVKRAEQGRGLPGRGWHVLELPACLAGRVTQISADGRLLVAVTGDRQLYSHDMPRGDLSADRWTWRWGPYFWSGAGMRLWPDVTAMATSDFGSDQRFADSSGRERAPIGVATVYLLRGDGRRITYLDPWLPADDSREVCGPRRGTVALAGLSGAGSTVMVVSRAGEVFTRLYDFDVSGANTVFGDYSWERGRPASDPRWQLPAPEWVRHRRPPGRFTDRVALARSGKRSHERLLRIAGRDRRGRAGYWEKTLPARTWRFVRAAGVLGGRWLPRSGRSRAFAPDDRRYAGAIDGAAAEIADFNPECSPARMRVSVAPGATLDLLLHTSDGLRQESRAAGLDDTPREYNGAIEVPGLGAMRADDPRRAWVEAHLDGAITVAPVAVTATRLRFLRQCWALTRDGGAARPDVPRVPPDLGMVVARAAEQLEDGWTPAC